MFVIIKFEVDGHVEHAGLLEGQYPTRDEAMGAALHFAIHDPDRLPNRSVEVDKDRSLVMVEDELTFVVEEV
jgi:hypothetical protein